MDKTSSGTVRGDEAADAAGVVVLARRKLEKRVP